MTISIPLKKKTMIGSPLPSKSLTIKRKDHKPTKWLFLASVPTLSRFFFFFLFGVVDGAYVKKDTRLSSPAQLQFSRSITKESGNEANVYVHFGSELDDSGCLATCVPSSTDKL